MEEAKISPEIMLQFDDDAEEVFVLRLKHRLWIFVALCVILTAIFMRGISAPMNTDFHERIHAAGPSAALGALTAGDEGICRYGPAAVMRDMVYRAVFGYKTAGARMMNILLHASVSTFVFEAAYALGLGLGGALISAVFFAFHAASSDAVHTLNVETLAAALGMAAMLLFAAKETRRSSIVSVTLFAAALIAHDGAAAFAAVIPAYAMAVKYCEGEEIRLRKRHLSFAALVIAYILSLIHISEPTRPY